MTPAVSIAFLTEWEFWVAVGVLAGVYGIFTLGLQLNVGYTGILNFGQAGFMAIGAYTMAILVAEHGVSFWLAMPIATATAMLAGVIIGLPSLRLRTDYFAIVTVAFAEVVRFTALNARELTGGAQGTFGFDDAWLDVSDSLSSTLQNIGIDARTYQLVPLMLVVWLALGGLAFALARLQRTPWGRVLRAIREDEDAAQALGKNALSYKLQSLALAAALGSIAGYFLALNLAFINPTQFEPIFTFIGYTVLILGGLASYAGVMLGTVILFVLLEGTRFLDLPLSGEKVAAIRLMVVGLVLIALAYWRPEGILGKREEMVLRD